MGYADLHLLIAHSDSTRPFRLRIHECRDKESDLLLPPPIQEPPAHSDLHASIRKVLTTIVSVGYSNVSLSCYVLACQRLSPNQENAMLCPVQQWILFRQIMQYKSRLWLLLKRLWQIQTVLHSVCRDGVMGTLKENGERGHKPSKLDPKATVIRSQKGV